MVGCDEEIMKTVLIVGCCGVIGRTLIEHLQDKYTMIGCDIIEEYHQVEKYYQCDISKYDELELVFLENRIDVVIDLAALAETNNIPSIDYYNKMVDCYLNGTFYLLSLMKKYNVKKVILASTNHVTDYYEENGYSLLGREIRTDDYPISKSIYGDLKLAAENYCRSFFYDCGITSVSFRIGTFRIDYEVDHFQDRWNRTVIKTEDLLFYFEKAIEKECKTEVYYLVSDNKNKPWDTSGLETFK